MSICIVLIIIHERHRILIIPQFTDVYLQNKYLAVVDNQLHHMQRKQNPQQGLFESIIQKFYKHLQGFYFVNVQVFAVLDLIEIVSSILSFQYPADFKRYHFDRICVRIFLVILNLSKLFPKIDIIYIVDL